METLTQQVKIIQFLTYKVVLEAVDTGKRYELSRRFFEKRLDMGLLEPVNPEVLPKVF